MSIFRRFVHILERALPRPLFLAIYGCFANIKNIGNLLIGYGQWRTCFTHRPTDRRGNPIPWFTYSALEYLEGIDLTEMSVFEFGCGNSTRYWSTRARSVVAIEDNPSWADEVRGKLGENASIVIVQLLADYAAAIALNRESYDLIIIDGTDRLGCAREIDGRLRDGGFVILDDADEHVEAAAVLRAYDLIEVDFAGFSPVNSYTKTTSFFFHRDFRPKPRRQSLPLHSTCHPKAYLSQLGANLPTNPPLRRPQRHSNASDTRT